MENLSKKADVEYVDANTAKVREQLDHLYHQQYIDCYASREKVSAVQGEIEEIKSMRPLARLKKLTNTRACGGDWEQEYEHIRQIVDPYDAMTDTQVFGAEIPWDFWRA